MPVPSFVWSETNTGGASVTDSIAQIVFAAADQNSNTVNLATLSPIVVPQTGFAYSYEKYMRLKLTQVASNGFLAFGVYFAAFPPEDAGLATAPLTLSYGITSTYATPVNTASLVATTLCSTNVTQPGAAISAPTNTIGSYSPYIVQQMKVAAGAFGGNTIWPNPFLLLQYVYN